MRPIALLGTGRTGTHVGDLVETRRFNSKSSISLQSLKDCRSFICFLPPKAFLEHVDVLVESQLPGVVGTTGIQWPSAVAKNLEKAGLRWVWGRNFSLGMQALRSALLALKESKLFLPGSSKWSIEESHHQFKQDTPSGTALAMKEWWGDEIEVTSIREGDIVGEHEIRWLGQSETLGLSHKVLDRSVFAQGAVWAEKSLNKFYHQIDPGLISFEDLFALAREYEQLRGENNGTKHAKGLDGADYSLK